MAAPGNGDPIVLSAPSVGDGTPVPPPDRPFAYGFNPTDCDIINLLRSKIDNVPVIGNMVNKVNLYKETPNDIVGRLHQYIVDGNPHYLVFTKTTVLQERRAQSEYLQGILKKKLRRERKVGKVLKGYWRPHGARAFITDQNRQVVGSKLRFTYDDGHLREKIKGMQRSIWNMIEYQIVSKTRNKDQLKYTICKLYMDPEASHSKIFREKEAEKALAMEMRNEILTLEHRHRGWNHIGAMNIIEADIANCLVNSSTSYEYEQELVDRFRS